MDLYSWQLQAMSRLKDGSILCGQVGSGKSRTALAFYYIFIAGGDIEINGEGEWKDPTTPRDLYVITTAKKRDDGEWLDEAAEFGNRFEMNVDSWNNIKKYVSVYGAFFIFDEQHLTGSGAWVKSFYKIAKKNKWILLTATPGDKWVDYIPVFVANGFYRNKTDFQQQHCIFARYCNYPKIVGYQNEALLLKHRKEILVPMKKVQWAKRNKKIVVCDYDEESYNKVRKQHWDVFDDCPIMTPSKCCFLQRRVVNSDRSRLQAVVDLLEVHEKAIIFYNYDFELDLLRMLLDSIGVAYSEWNGHNHESILEGEDKWAYLVNYYSGSDGWNCILTDTIIFYSASYSYRTMVQAEGRIDRLNTPFEELFYYRLYSAAPIDKAIRYCLMNKKDFNEAMFS